MACSESSITTACYLCNTRRKRRAVRRFSAVPLLRVQTLSVIVMVRRRGASRGRPVLGGSLKSLAFSGSVRKREATKRVLRDKGTNLGCFTQRIRNLPYRATWRFNMKMVKSLILGSAAGLLAMSGAQAADLPVKAKAVEYVRICSLYGAGFFYIPGTDTCIKLGGYLRVDTSFNSSGTQDAPAWNGDPGQMNRYRDYFATRARLALTVDTRTATEYGVVRTFGQGDFTMDTLGGATFNPTTINATSPVGSSNLLFSAGGGYVAVEMGFIQFAGFTFGRSASAFATPWHGYPGNNTSSLLGGHDSVTGVNNIQYTAQFGNGVSGTIGLDEPTVYNRTTVANLTLPLTATGGIANAYAGVHAPDVVGNIRVDQAWGLFQISGVAHEVN